MPPFHSLYARTVPRWLRPLLRDARLVAIQSARILGRPGRHEVSFRFHGGRPLVRVGVNGLKLHVDLRDLGVGQPVYLTGSYERSETELLRRTLRPGHTFVDIGANIGYFSTLAAVLVGPAGTVLAVEPDPYNHYLLRTNVRANRLGNVRPFRCALGAEPGQAALCRSAYNYGDHRLGMAGNGGRDTTTVPVVPLDQLLAGAGAGRVNVIKMDVQGYECHVLAGMAGTLRQSGPLVLLTEFWPHGMRQTGGDPERFFRTLTDAGFRAAVLTDDGTERPVGWDDVTTLLPPPDPYAPDASYLNLVFRR